jgi:hypothetical protein
MSFFERLRVAFLFLFGRLAVSELAQLPASPLQPALPAETPPPPAATPVAAQNSHASALFVLGLMQREGRLLDFLQEDMSGFSDAEVGAAARIVHEGCRKVMKEYLPMLPVVAEAEGAKVTVPQGFDANRFRLTGNVTGLGPWIGSLKHHGWMAAKIELPAVPTSVDLAVLAPAEVEL